jgi:hypothetical protein
MSELIWKNKENIDVFILYDETIEIIDPQEAALCLTDHLFGMKMKMKIKIKIATALYGGGVKSLMSVDMKTLRVQLENGVEEPSNWNEFVQHFNRIVKLKAFV